MSHKDLTRQRSEPEASCDRALQFGRPDRGRWPVGFWWSELTHPYFAFSEVGYEVELFSPLGGRSRLIE